MPSARSAVLWTDAELDAKVTDLSAPVIGAARVPPMIEAARSLGKARDVATLIASARG